jgi:hypothetical protein
MKRSIAGAVSSIILSAVNGRNPEVYRARYMASGLGGVSYCCVEVAGAFSTPSALKEALVPRGGHQLQQLPELNKGFFTLGNDWG